MTGTLYIDGVDIYTTYGVYIMQGSYNGLLSFPSLKEPDKNDWHECDGIEVDLSNPVLDSKQFPLNFGAVNGANVGGFVEYISAGAYHIFNFIDLGITKTLRLISNSKYAGMLGSIRVICFEFADDFPIKYGIHAEPISTSILQRGYKLDEKDFSEYGVAILEGSEAEILKSPAVKQNLLVNIKGLSGVSYDGGAVLYKEKDVTLNCLMLASSLAEFWQNYNALLFDLIKSEERVISVERFSEAYKCYYKSSEISEFNLTGKVWCKFTLTLVFTSYRSLSESYLLATSNGKLVITESELYYINLAKYGN